MTTEEQLNYYANLLIIQYNGKLRAAETIRSLVKMLIGSSICDDVEDAYGMSLTVGSQGSLLDEIDKLINLGISGVAGKQSAVMNMYGFHLATGHQLDILAKYIGIGRASNPTAGKSGTTARK